MPFFTALEPRRLLAFDQSFTDVDGDVYRVELIGSGAAVVVTQDTGPDDANPATGFIGSLTITGTDAKSRLRITVTQAGAGNGRVGLLGLSATVLKSASLAPVDSEAGSAVTFADVGQLVFGDVGSGSEMDLNAGAPTTNLGTRTVAFRDIGFQLTISNGLRAATITATTIANAQFTLPQGAGTIVSSGDARIFFVAGASINEIRVGGFATLRGTINGDVRKVRADSFGPSSNSPLTVTGVLGALTAAGDLAAPFVVGRYGTINAGSLTGTVLSWTAPDAAGGKGIAIKSLTVVGDIIGTTIGPTKDATVPGTISSFKAASIADALIVAGAITTFNATGGINSADITLLNPTGVVSKAFKVGGVIVESSVEAEHGAGFASVRALGFDEVSWECGFVTSLTLGVGAEGGMRDNSFIHLRGADTRGFAMKTVNLGETIFESTVAVLSGNGTFGKVTGRVLQSADIKAFAIGSIVATGAPGGGGFALGDMFVHAFGDPVSKPSIGTIDIRGAVRFADIVAAGSIDRVNIGSIPSGDEEFRIAAGAPGRVEDFPGDLGGLNPGARINRITISGPFVAGTPTLSGALFIAPAIGTVTVKGLVNTTGANDTGQPFGFGARTFGKVTLKNGAGQTVKPVISATPGEYNVFDPEANGRFLFVVYA